MIEINLLPEDLRNKLVKASKPEVVKNPVEGLEPKHYVVIVPAVLILLIFIHLLLGVFSIVKTGQLHMLRSKWQKLEPQRKALDEYNSEFAAVSEDAQILQQLLRDRIVWSEKLNKMSLKLPRGVWFNSLTVNQKELVIKGSVVSLNKEELGMIKELIESHKSDPEFIKNFNNLEMVSAEKKTIGSYDITDFTLSASLKTK
jgi:hypothetical protein